MIFSQGTGFIKQLNRLLKFLTLNRLKRPQCAYPYHYMLDYVVMGTKFFLTPALFIDFQQLIVKGLVQGNRMSLPCMLIFPQTGWALNRF